MCVFCREFRIPSRPKYKGKRKKKWRTKTKKHRSCNGLTGSQNTCAKFLYISPPNGVNFRLWLNLGRSSRSNLYTLYGFDERWFAYMTCSTWFGVWACMTCSTWFGVWACMTCSTWFGVWAATILCINCSLRMNWTILVFIQQRDPPAPAASWCTAPSRSVSYTHLTLPTKA